MIFCGLWRKSPPRRGSIDRPPSVETLTLSTTQTRYPRTYPRSWKPTAPRSWKPETPGRGNLEKEQIQELNTYVVNYAVPKILSEVDMYHQYRKDITTLPVPMLQPVNISRAGTKSLPLKPFF
jgi:hypothetical protein